MFLTAFLFCVFWDCSNSKQKAKQYTQNLATKLQNWNENSHLSWASLIELWRTWPKSIYYSSYVNEGIKGGALIGQRVLSYGRILVTKYKNLIGKLVFFLVRWLNCQKDEGCSYMKTIWIQQKAKPAQHQQHVFSWVVFTRTLNWLARIWLVPMQKNLSMQIFFPLY